MQDFPTFSDPPTRTELLRLVGWIENTRNVRSVQANADKWQALALLFTHEMLLACIIHATEHGHSALDALARVEQHPQSLFSAHPFMTDVADLLASDSQTFERIAREVVERVRALLGAFDQPVKLD